MSKQKKAKEKKPKTVYIDDGSTVFDMSGLELTKKHYFSGANRLGDSSPSSAPPRAKPLRQPSRFKACLRTYFEAVKMMLLPMLVFVGALCILFLILWFLF